MARGRWSDVLMVFGIVFLLLAVVVFALFALGPTGLTNTSGSDSWLLPLGGALGLILIGLGMYQRKGEGLFAPRR